MAGEDPQYTAWLRQRPCVFEGGDCDGPIEIHHRTGAGLALRAHDREGAPLCRRHHRDRHSATGIFRGMTKAKRKQWEADMVKTYQALYAADQGDDF